MGFTVTAETACRPGGHRPARRAPRCGRVLIVGRDDQPDDGRLRAHLEASGIPVDQVAAPGYADMMAEPHDTRVPHAAIEAVAGWLRSDQPAAAGPAEPEVLSSVVMDVGSVGRVRERACTVGREPRLFGITTEPAGSVPDGRPWIVFLNAGAAYRVGPEPAVRRTGPHPGGRGWPVPAPRPGRDGRQPGRRPGPRERRLPRPPASATSTAPRLLETAPRGPAGRARRPLLGGVLRVPGGRPDGEPGAGRGRGDQPAHVLLEGRHVARGADGEPAGRDALLHDRGGPAGQVAQGAGRAVAAGPSRGGPRARGAVAHCPARGPPGQVPRRRPTGRPVTASGPTSAATSPASSAAAGGWSSSSPGRTGPVDPAVSARRAIARLRRAGTSASRPSTTPTTRSRPGRPARPWSGPSRSTLGPLITAAADNAPVRPADDRLLSPP